MVRLIIKRLLVFAGILVGLVIGCLLMYLGYLALVKPWEVGLARVDSWSSAETWLDSDGNGYRDHGEPPMGGVCVWDALALGVPDNEEMARICDEPFFRTEELGKWPGPGGLTFRAGAACEDIYIFAKPPQGHRATTPMVVNGCHAEFGFAPEGSVPQDTRFSCGEYVRRKKMGERYQQIGMALGGLAVIAVSTVGSIKLIPR